MIKKTSQKGLKCKFAYVQILTVDIIGCSNFDGSSKEITNCMLLKDSNASHLWLSSAVAIYRALFNHWKCVGLYIKCLTLSALKYNIYLHFSVVCFVNVISVVLPFFILGSIGCVKLSFCLNLAMLTVFFANFRDTYKPFLLGSAFCFTIGLYSFGLQMIPKAPLYNNFSSQLFNTHPNCVPTWLVGVLSLVVELALSIRHMLHKLLFALVAWSKAFQHAVD